MLQSLNVILRGLTLTSKFVLLFSLAKWLPPAELGLYGLMAASINYGIMLLGWDFYTFSNRDLLGSEYESWPTILKNQGTAYLGLYTILVPTSLALFYFELLPWYLVGWFLALLILEHLAQELNRLLIAIGRPIIANVILFIRSGSWAWGALLLMLVQPGLRILETVFAAWTISGVIAVLTGFYLLRHLPWRYCDSTIDWLWIRQGFKVASVYLLGTLCLRGTLTLDRFFVRESAGSDMLGVYTFYITLAMALPTFLNAGVFAFIYPKAVSAYRNNELRQHRLHMKQLWRNTMAVTAGLASCALLLIWPLLHFLDRPIYFEHLPLFVVVLAAAALQAIGMVPHYGLYAFGSDKGILKCHVAGFIAFLIVSLASISLFPLFGVAFGLVAGFLTIFASKAWLYRDGCKKLDLARSTASSPNPT